MCAVQKIRGFILLCAIALIAPCAEAQQAGSTEPSFNIGAGPDGRVYSAAAYPDNRLLAVGWFANWDGLPADRMIRLHSTGAIDTSFQAPTGALLIDQAWLQSDGKILVSGAFTNLGGVTRTNFARLNHDGTVDSTFVANTPHRVMDVKELADGQLLVGGSFSAINGQARPGIVLLNSDGAVDESFSPSSLTGWGESIFVQPDGNFLVAGLSHSFNGSSTSGLARLDRSGAFVPGLDLDSTSFFAGRIFGLANGNVLIDAFTSPGRVLPNNALDQHYAGDGRSVDILAIQPDERHIVAGFSLVDATGAPSKLVRYDADGRLDPSFRTALAASPRFATVRPDGVIIIGGAIAPEGTATRETIMALRGNDATAGSQLVWHGIEFETIHNGPVTVKIVRQGNLEGTASVDWSTTFDAAQVHVTPAAGRSDFQPGQRYADVTITLAAAPSVSTELRLQLANAFGAEIGGAATAKLFLTNQVGSIRTAYSSFSYPEVGPTWTTSLERTGPLNQSFAVQWRLVGVNGSDPADDFAYATGVATFAVGAEQAALNPRPVDDTTADPDRNYRMEFTSLDPNWTFSSAAAMSVVVTENDLPGIPGEGTDASINDAAMTRNGGAIIAGSFQRVNGELRPSLARLTPYGRLDRGFQPDASIITAISDVFEQEGGKIAVSGFFKNVNGGVRTEIVRFLADGQLDASFAVTDLTNVSSIAPLPGGRILATGRGTRFNGVDGGINRGAIARIDDSGRRDPSFATFTASGGNARIFPLPNGQFYAYGNIVAHTAAYPDAAPFPVPHRGGIIRFNSDGSVDPAFNVTFPGMTIGTTNLQSSPSRVDVYPDGRLLAAGPFASINGQSAPGFARLSATGELDTAFVANVRQFLGTGSGILEFALNRDATQILGVVSNRFNPLELVIITTGGNLEKRINLDSRSAHVILPAQDGGFFLGGAFTLLGTERRFRYAWVTSDGAPRPFPEVVIEGIEREGNKSRMRVTSRAYNNLRLFKSGDLLNWTPLRPVGLLQGEQTIESEDSAPAFYKFAP